MVESKPIPMVVLPFPSTIGISNVKNKHQNPPLDLTKNHQMFFATKKRCFLICSLGNIPAISPNHHSAVLWVDQPVGNIMEQFCAPLTGLMKKTWSSTLKYRNLTHTHDQVSKTRDGSGPKWFFWWRNRTRAANDFGLPDLLRNHDRSKSDLHCFVDGHSFISLALQAFLKRQPLKDSEIQVPVKIFDKKTCCHVHTVTCTWHLCLFEKPLRWYQSFLLGAEPIQDMFYNCCICCSLRHPPWLLQLDLWLKFCPIPRWRSSSIFNFWMLCLVSARCLFFKNAPTISEWNEQVPSITHVLSEMTGCDIGECLPQKCY